MNGIELHEDAVVFDGLIVSNWSREVFEDMHRGGLTAVKPPFYVPLSDRVSGTGGRMFRA